MITQEQLGHAFGFVTMTPGELTAADNTDDTIHDISFLQFLGDADGMYIFSDGANYTFQKSKNGEDYILTKVALVKIGKDEASGLYLPGAEVYSLEGDDEV